MVAIEWRSSFGPQPCGSFSWSRAVADEAPASQARERQRPGQSMVVVGPVRTGRIDHVGSRSCPAWVAASHGAGKFHLPASARKLPTSISLLPARRWASSVGMAHGGFGGRWTVILASRAAVTCSCPAFALLLPKIRSHAVVPGRRKCQRVCSCNSEQMPANIAPPRVSRRLRPDNCQASSLNRLFLKCPEG